MKNDSSGNNLIAYGTYKKINNLNFIKIALALIVVFFHIKKLCGLHTGLLISHSVDFAVSSFFVISGLLVTWSFDKNSKLIGYALKRFFRIYPLYFVIIVIQMCLLLLLTTQPFNSGQYISSLKYFVSNILFLNFLQPTIPGVFENLKYNAVNGSLWIIKIVVLFYILLPSIYYSIKKFGVKALLFLYFFSALFFILISGLSSFDLLSKQFPSQLRFFITGIIFYLYGHKIKFSSLYAILIPIILFASNYYLDSNIIYKTFVYPLSLGFIIYLIGFHKFSLNIKHDISYAVYIIHFPVIQLLLFLNFSTNNYYIFGLTVLIVVILLSLLSRFFLENKFIELSRRLIRSESQSI